MFIGSFHSDYVSGIVSLIPLGERDSKLRSIGNLISELENCLQYLLALKKYHWLSYIQTITLFRAMLHCSYMYVMWSCFVWSARKGGVTYLKLTISMYMYADNSMSEKYCTFLSMQKIPVLRRPIITGRKYVNIFEISQQAKNKISFVTSKSWQFLSPYISDISNSWFEEKERLNIYNCKLLPHALFYYYLTLETSVRDHPFQMTIIEIDGRHWPVTLVIYLHIHVELLVSNISIDYSCSIPPEDVHEGR